MIPSNANFNVLNSKNFKAELSIDVLPNTIIHTTSINIPSFTIGEIPMTYKQNRIPLSGNTMEYEPISVAFDVDEDMKNYLEILAWMKGMTYPERPDQYLDFINSKNKSGGANYRDLFSDISIIITTNNMIPNINITAHNTFPTMLDGFNMDSREDEKIESNVSFMYSNISYEYLTK